MNLPMDSKVQQSVIFSHTSEDVIVSKTFCIVPFYKSTRVLENDTSEVGYFRKTIESSTGMNRD